MRGLPVLAIALLLVGCVGNAAQKDAPTDSVTQDSVTDAVNGVTGQAGAQIKVLAPLQASLTTDGPAWQSPGATTNFSVSAPANAVGDVTYTWITGALAGSVPLLQLNMNTKEIEPGQSKTLTFDQAGLYRFHCHPHAAFMGTMNVTVVDGVPASDVTVSIVDGPSLSDYRFVPENVTIGKGGHVTYVNKGTMVHTATESPVQTPPVHKIAASGNSGSITWDTTLSGWQYLGVVMQDTAGHIGVVNTSVFVASPPTFTPQTFAFDFAAAGPGAASGQLPDSKSFTFQLFYSGKLSLNLTSSTSVQGTADPSGATDGVNQVEAHLKEMGETQDTLTCAPSNTCDQSAHVRNVTYQLVIKADQGAEISGTAVVSVLYDLVPPSQDVPYFDESKPHTHPTA